MGFPPGEGGHLAKVPREGPRPSGCGSHSLLWFCRTPVLRAPQGATQGRGHQGTVTQGLPTLVPTAAGPWA